MFHSQTTARLGVDSQHLRRLSVLSLIVVVSFACQWFRPRLTCAQDAANNAGRDGANLADSIASRVDAVRQLHREYENHIRQRKGLEGTRQRIADTMRQTEQSLGQIRNAGIITALQQLQANVVANDFSDAAATWRATANRMDVARNPGGIQALDNGANNARLEAFMRSAQLGQLDIAARTTVQQRVECLRDAQKLEQDIAAWRKTDLGWLSKYWYFGDPSRVHTSFDNLAMLREFENVADSNYAALITRGMLHRRLGELEEAEADYESVIEAKDWASPIAHAARSELSMLQGETKKAKVDMQAAIKPGIDNPYVRWFRGIINGNSQEWATAEGDWQAVLKSGKHEVAARRYLAIVLASKAKGNGTTAKKAVEHAQLASDVSGGKNWSVELALGQALYAADKKEEGMKRVLRARDLASDENREVCETVADQLRRGDGIHWDFFR